jgi:hypothetical protein
MVSNRLPPVMRAFFGNTPNVGGTNKDSQGQSPGYQQPEQDREATEEEAKRALEALASSEEFQKNSLNAELSLATGYPVIIVKNAAGVALRSLRRREILRLLQAPAPNDTARSGRILDRRI